RFDNLIDWRDQPAGGTAPGLLAGGKGAGLLPGGAVAGRRKENHHCKGRSVHGRQAKHPGLAISRKSSERNSEVSRVGDEFAVLRQNGLQRRDKSPIRQKGRLPFWRFQDNL